MTDLTADKESDYRAAMARAEAASGIERDPVTGEELNGIEAFMRGETPALPELEGAVPVSASDQPLTPAEPVVETATSPEQQPEAPAVEPTVAELQAQLAAAEARLAEKESFIGRQSSEIGELRTAVDEIRQAQQQPVAPAVAPIPITQELIDTNPGLAVQEAYRQKNENALHAAFEVWKEEDPFTAATWLADRKLEQQQAEMDARFAAQQAAIEKANAGQAESAENAQWKAAFDEVKATRPDFLENAERLITEVASQYPNIANVLASGDAAAKAQALAALYALDKMGNPEALRKQLAEDAAAAEAEAVAARAAAGVVSGQTTVGQTTELKTTEELEAEAYTTRQRAKPSLARGFTRGS